MLHTRWKHNESLIHALITEVWAPEGPFMAQISAPQLPLFECLLSAQELEAKFTLETQPKSTADA